MTSKEVEVLVRAKTRKDVVIHTLEEHQGDAVAFLSYSIDDRKQLTIWHTEVSPTMRHQGSGGRLVEMVLELARGASATLRVVCPFAKSYLARHPELRELNSVVNGEAFVEGESLYDKP